MRRTVAEPPPYVCRNGAPDAAPDAGRACCPPVVDVANAVISPDGKTKVRSVKEAWKKHAVGNLVGLGRR